MSTLPVYISKFSFKKVAVGVFSLALIFFSTGCNEILSEEPCSTYTPSYFKTEGGVIGGITSLYAILRYIYGNGYYLNAFQTGTDETTYGQNSDHKFKDSDLSGVRQVTTASSRSDVLWDEAFPIINTANGVIQNGRSVGVSNTLIVGARFFRAFYYFMLVQTFGGVPLDLDSGELEFNISAVCVFERNTISEVYTKAVFPDLESAVNGLPVTLRAEGGVTKTLARLYLAKAYLTYAWWLENPHTIPTYPTTDRTDLDGHNAQWYFQQAYNIATTAIGNPRPFELQPTFYDVNVAMNDRNSEILLYANHTFNMQHGGHSSTSYSTGGALANFVGWMTQWNYTGIQISTNADWSGPFLNSVQRAATQDLGRPWTEMAPPIRVFKSTFADKANDSRYDGTFTTTYRCNMDVSGLSSEHSELYNANGLPIEDGDAVLTFFDHDTSGADYSNSKYKSNVGAGVLSRKSDFVIEPSAISRIKYPGIWKFGPYRTGNNGGLGQPNASSTRPWNIAKFSELFFVAAEAAVKGANTKAVAGKYANDGTARGLINIIRARAGKWNWDYNGDSTKIEDNSAEMMAKTPSTITIDYILEERSREYFGEGYRWYDLVRTQEWAELASTYTICGNEWSDRTPKTVSRNIQPYLYLRPIPQGQLDGMLMSKSEKDKYQNPGYD